VHDKGGGSLYLACAVMGRELVLISSDNGAGIREPDRVFDPFYTTNLSAAEPSGIWSACYGIIKEHNGEISAQIVTEGGAIFTVRLPVAASVCRPSLRTSRLIGGPSQSLPALPFADTMSLHGPRFTTQ